MSTPSKSGPEQVPVLIVGGSLVGLTTAALMASYGIRTLAVERHAGTAIHPRAGHFQIRTVEILRELGLEAEVRAKSRETYDPEGGIIAVESLAGRELARFIGNLNEGVDGRSPTGRIFIDQDVLEPLLRRRAEALGAALRYRTEMIAFEQDADGVDARVRDLDTGEEQDIRAEYMVAADGNRSRVRRALGIDMSGYGLHSRSVTIYFEADCSGLLQGRNSGVFYVANPTLRGFFRLNRAGRRGFLAVNTVGADVTRDAAVDVWAGMTQARALELLRAAIGVPDLAVTVRQIVPWEAEANVASRYGQGRVFLAGDAAHVVPPNGGFGGNTGVQDAHNLAWKLAMVLKREAGPGLLETYGEERRPVGEFTVHQAYARYATRVVPERGIGDARPLVDDLTIEIGYRYASAAVVDPGAAEDPSFAHPDALRARPGSRAPHVTLRREGRLVSTLDLFGRRFVLLSGPAGGAWRAAARTAAQTLAVPVDAWEIGAGTGLEERRRALPPSLRAASGRRRAGASGRLRRMARERASVPNRRRARPSPVRRPRARRRVRRLEQAGSLIAEAHRLGRGRARACRKRLRETLRFGASQNACHGSGDRMKDYRSAGCRERALAAGGALLTLCLWHGANPAMAQATHAAAAEPSAMARRCIGLATNMNSWPDSTTHIETVVWRAAGAKVNTPAGEISLPAHCEITAVMHERIGEAGQHYAIHFHVRLPAAWNERFFFQGGGGTDGDIGDALGRIEAGTPNALDRGFAVVSQDSGHDNARNTDPARGGPSAFGFDPRARADYGGTSLKPVAVAAKALIRTYYGRGPQHSYFVGCSKGGQEGMFFAQRDPDVFDGIVAASPGFSLPRAAVAEAWDTQAFASLIDPGHTPPGDTYSRLPATFSKGQFARVRAAVLAACDADDGAVDGITADWTRCDAHRVDRKLRDQVCTSAPDCLSQAQVDVIERVYGGAKNSRGKALYASWPFDAGIGSDGWRAWKIGPEDGNFPGINVAMGATALASIFTTPPTVVGAAPADAFAYALHFDFDTDAPKIYATYPPFERSAWRDIGARSPDLSAFRDHGAKLIVPQGVSDPVFSINDTKAWYDEVNRLNQGKAADFVRLFPVPGMAHCGGGPATDQFDAFDALVGWVERGTPPDRILATAGPSSPWPGRTRPLCPYPEVARYLGRGSLEDAANFRCE